jgi:hypothetical protein
VGVTIARGTFTVQIDPVEHPQDGIGRMTLTKTWFGDLSGSGAGTMLSAGDPGAGRAGYVAVETVTGSLGDREGTFAFQQFGTMNNGIQDLRYEVVAGSGTDQLAGISGTL